MNDKKYEVLSKITGKNINLNAGQIVETKELGGDEAVKRFLYLQAIRAIHEEPKINEEKKVNKEKKKPPKKKIDETDEEILDILN